MSETPTVTLALVGYNHEAYIADAIKGAFDQTHPSLEIILSDDGSKDGTFDIMQKMAAEYDGPHQIVLNRNESNLGVAGHMNRIFGMARGDLVVPNAGDDISRPDRCAKLWAAFTEKRAVL